MRILPVLDLQNGQVVRGIGGRRHEYRPIVSRLTPSAHPWDVARAFRDQLGLAELYLADLDAIAGADPALETYGGLRALGFRLWVDAGVRDLHRAALLAGARIEGIVVGLETVSGPQALETVCRELGNERIVFSLDLKEGRPLGDTSGWPAPDPEMIAQQAIALGIRRLLVLDLARVGGEAGTGTETLCRRLVQAHPDVELAAGGGVRGLQDLERLRQAGVQAVLVASALHDGQLRREDLAQL